MSKQWVLKKMCSNFTQCAIYIPGTVSAKAETANEHAISAEPPPYTTRLSGVMKWLIMGEQSEGVVDYG